MKRVYIHLMLAVTLMLSGVSCVQKNTSIASAADERANVIDSTLQLQYAKWFTVAYTKQGKIITVLNPWESGKIYAQYYLVKGNKASKQDLKLPFHRLILLSSTQIGLLDRINTLDSVVGVSDGSKVYNKRLKEKLQQKQIVDLGSSMAINEEQLLVLHPDVVFKTAFMDAKSKDNPLIKAQIPLVYTVEWMEHSPLARLEWIKFFAAFFDQEKMADSVFTTAVAKYTQLSKSSKSIPNKPTILQGIPYSGVWYMPGGGSYKAKLFADAGGDYYWKNTTEAGSLSLGIEEVISKQLHADIWLLDAPMDNMQQFLNIDERFAHFDAVKKGQVYTHAHAQNNETNSYWETSIAYPERVLEDLVHILHPAWNTNYKMHYYSKVKNSH